MLSSEAMEQKIRNRIEELEKARDNHVNEANRVLALHVGAIAELRALLAPEPDGDGSSTQTAKNQPGLDGSGSKT